MTESVSRHDDRSAVIPPHPSADVDPGRCWECGYFLRGLGEIRRCPDCGRAFDPADPGTTNRRRHDIRSITRRLLVPPGWPVVGLTALAAGLVIIGTGGTAGFRATFEDWALLRDVVTRRRNWMNGSWQWRIYSTGVALVALAIVWSVLRLALRGLIIARHHPPRDLRRGRTGMASAAALCLGVSLIWIACGGVKRIGREWAHEALATPPKRTVWTPVVAPCPMELPADQKKAVIATLASFGDTPIHRRVGLGLMLQHNAHANVSDVQATIDGERDVELLATKLRAVALYRDPTSLPSIEGFLDDSRPAVRAAAADAIGLVHMPGHAVGEPRGTFGIFQSEFRGQPPIPLGWLMMRGRLLEESSNDDPLETYPFFTRRYNLSPERRARLSRMMLDAQTLEEREAAARALLPLPPDRYRLRVSEWGVWLNENGDLKTARGVAEEIPPFVHRAGNPIAEMAPRLRQVMIITKPIVHLTVSEPMPVDIEVRIRHGRPWFVYPMPDDFEVHAETKYNGASQRRGTQPNIVPLQFLKPLDPPASFGKLDAGSLRSGYPWCDPPHRSSGPISGKMSPVNDIVEMGVHWQSLIASPAQQPWMTEPTVGTDPRHAWWKRLREVDCAWISSRGESERFLYYDGPTRMKMPFQPRLEDSVLHFDTVKRAEDEEVLGAQRLSPSKRKEMRVRLRDIEGTDLGWFALIVRTEAGRVKCMPFHFSTELPPPDKPLAFDPVNEGTGAAERILRGVLLDRGMLETEVAGMLDCWREEFFNRDGIRVLQVMPPTAYESFCPMVVRPAPTEYVRVGIVVTELTGAAITKMPPASGGGDVQSD